MNGQIKKSHSDKFKLKVALAAFRADKTISDLCHEFGVVSSQIYIWKNQLEKRGIEIFENKNKPVKQEVNIEKLHAIIGKLVVNRDNLIQ